MICNLGPPTVRKSTPAARRRARVDPFRRRVQGSARSGGPPCRRKNPATPDFEQALADLEAIVDKLEHGELPLEEALRQFERGIALRAFLPGRPQASRTESGDPPRAIDAGRARPVRARRARHLKQRPRVTTTPGPRASRSPRGVAAARRARARPAAAFRRLSSRSGCTLLSATRALAPGKRIRPALVYATAETLSVALAPCRWRGLRGRAHPRVFAGA